jgi:hypothetical protein
MYIISQLDIYVLVPQYVNIYDTMWPMSIPKAEGNHGGIGACIVEVEDE